MRKPIIGGVVASLALGGAAVAFAGDSPSRSGDTAGPDETLAVPGGPLVTFAEGPGSSFAEDLAAELGVSAEEVEQALQAVAQKHEDERQRHMAEMLGEYLDGVSVEEIEAALAVAEEQMHEAIEKGDPPAPDQFAETLADELGLSEQEISDALATMREEAFSTHREDDALKRLEGAPPLLEIGPRGRELPPIGPPPRGPGVSFAFPAG